MKSIKNRLFLQIGIIVVILILLFMSAYTLLFNPIYMAAAKNKLFNQYKYINKLNRDDYTTIEKELNDYNKGFYVDAFIHNNQGTLIYQSKEYLVDSDKLKQLDILPAYLEDIPSFLEISDEEKINNNMSFIWAHDYLLDTKTLNAIGTLDNGDHLVLRVRLIPSEISIVSTNRFAPIVGIMLFVIGMGFAYILSTTFTKPLIEMSKATTEISNLNFDTKCDVESKDELGQLAAKINLLSEKLKVTIENLNVRNSELNNEIIEKTKIDEQRKQLLNNVSHELKTPLTLMQSYADGLKLNVAQDHDKADYYCDVIIDETEKMNDLINNLLNINRLTFDDIIHVHTEVEIVAFLKGSLDKYSGILLNQNIDFIFNDIKPTIVYTNPKNFETVITNLIDNAIKYVDNNKQISVSLIDNDSTVSIEVYNSASLIPEDELEKIWDSFYKLDESRNRNVGGHGLGLSIIKAIQEADQLGYGVKNTNTGVLFWVEVRKATPYT